MSPGAKYDQSPFLSQDDGKHTIEWLALYFAETAFNHLTRLLKAWTFGQGLIKRS